MRTITQEYKDRLMKECPVYATIMNTPKPDFTELHRLNLEFEKWIAKEQEKDREIMMEALKKNGILCIRHRLLYGRAFV